MQLILRKAQMDVIKVLQDQNMAQQDIQQVVDSPSMKTFLSNLRKNPSIQKKVQSHVDKLLAPGNIETYLQKRRERKKELRREQLLITLLKLQHSKNFRTKEKVHQNEDEQSFMTQLWDHLIRDLYQN